MQLYSNYTVISLQGNFLVSRTEVGSRLVAQACVGYPGGIYSFSRPPSVQYANLNPKP